MNRMRRSHDPIVNGFRLSICFEMLTVRVVHTSVLLNAASAVHSARLVGLERAKMIGRSLQAAISCRISGVKRPGVADAPIKICNGNGTLKENFLLGYDSLTVGLISFTISNKSLTGG